MPLTLDNKIKSCSPKVGVPGPMNRATAYVYSPIPEGVNAAHLSVEIGGQFVPRLPNCDVMLYCPGDKSGTWECLAQITESYFVENFDFTD